MRKPDLPPNERERLKELLSLELLDSEQEPEFQDLVTLASQITDCPVSLVSLVDAERQWFKAKVGTEAQETPRDISFCGHAIHQDGVFVVENALEDERFRDNPLVTLDPNIRFYAGQPLITSRGFRIGTLCVIDRVAKRLSPLQFAQLKTLGKQVMRLVELRTHLREHEIREKKLLAAQRTLEESQNILETTVQNLGIERDLRERFVATLTHDLRTPMTAAKMSSQLLARKADDPSAVRVHSKRISANMDRADSMIRDLLDANRLKAGDGIPITIDRHELDLLLRATIQGLEELHGPRFLLELPESPTVGYWDPTGVQRMVENLATNAIKYGTQDTPVSVRALTTPGWIELSVHNEGDPIAPDDQATLFQPYRRTASAINSGQRGWGIGLTLVKGLADSHGGSVCVQSSAQRGTVFTVRLPLDSRERA